MKSRCSVPNAIRESHPCRQTTQYLCSGDTNSPRFLTHFFCFTRKTIFTVPSQLYLCVCVCVYCLSETFQTADKLSLAFTRAFAKLRKMTISSVMSVSLFILLMETTRPPLEGFSQNLIFEYFF